MKTQVLKNIVLRPTVPAENDMINAFQSNQRYAAKSQLGREWLFRGFVLLKQRIAGVASGDRNAIIMAAIHDGAFDYQTVVAYLDALDSVAQDSVAATKPGEVSEQRETLPVANSGVDAGIAQQELEKVVEEASPEPAEVHNRWAHLKNLAGSGD